MTALFSSAAWLLWFAFGQEPYYLFSPDRPDKWTMAEAFESKRDCEASKAAEFYKMWNEISIDNYKKTQDSKDLRMYVHWKCLPETIKP